MASTCCSATAIDTTQIVILGSGGAAMAAAITAAERGAQVHVVERGTIGGTCVNVGCIPSKHLVRCGQLEHWCELHKHQTVSNAVNGCPCPGMLDAPKLRTARQALVEQLRYQKYERVLGENPRITTWHGEARFHDPQSVWVRTTADDGSRVDTLLRFDRCLIAVGAAPCIPPIDGLAEVPFWTSTEALASDQIPRRLAVIGSSAVALELAQAYARLGSRVWILARHGLCTRTDPLVGDTLGAALVSDGRIEIRCHTRVERVRYRDGLFTMTLDSQETSVEVDALLVACGRRPNTAALQLDAAGVHWDATSGTVPVNDRMQTNVPNIYAAGDCTNMPQLVYVAAAAGTRAAIQMTGGDAKLDLSLVPWVIFTDPQVAAVGLTEAEAHALGLQTQVRTLPVTNVPRSIVHGEKYGFLKVVADITSKRILGAQAVASEASDMIATVAVAMRGGLTVPDLAELLIPYLTASEAVKLVAQSFTRDVQKLSCCAG